MRTISLPAPVLATALGCLLLAGCAVQGTQAAAPAGGSAEANSASHAADPVSRDPDMRFLALNTRVLQHCAPDDAPAVPDDKGDAGGPIPPLGSAPGPEDPPGAGPEAGTSVYGPGQTPPGTPNADGDIPVPLPSDAPQPPAPTSPSARPLPVEEVPPTPVERCAADEHALRIRQAFTTAPAGYEALRDALTALDYPATRIHRAPDHAGAPRVLIDLRFMGDNLALEVTATTAGVTVEPFGVSEQAGVHVTDVHRTPTPAPTS